MAQELPSASTIEGVRFTAQVLLPSLLRGPFRPRRRAWEIATRLDVDGHAVSLVGDLRRKHGPGPFWVRAGGDRALLVTAAEDVRRALDGSPDPYAPDPEAKRKGMTHFQPTALTISREPQWGSRRRFTEEVLDTREAAHRLCGRFAAAVAGEAEAMLGEVEAEHERYLAWEPFNRCVRRIAARIVLGDAARDDARVWELLSALMDEANGLPDPAKTSDHYEPYRKRIETYVADAEQGSLVALFAAAPRDAETDPPGQVTHWLFALGDTLAINAFRALALLTTHPSQRARALAEAADAERSGAELTASGVHGLDYLGACLQDAMRLYPTTPLLSRETLVDVDWNGATVPAGTQVLIPNGFNHRDTDRHPFADRFAPGEWLGGDAAEDWTFSHFSHGPQGCPGAHIALFAGKALLATLLTARRVDLIDGPDLDPERPLPKMLDFFRLRFAVESLP